MTRQLPSMREQVHDLAWDPDVAAIVDLKRIGKVLDSWPAETPVAQNDPLTYLLPVALPHALTVGRSVRWVKRANP